MRAHSMLGRDYHDLVEDLGAVLNRNAKLINQLTEAQRVRQHPKASGEENKLGLMLHA